MAIRNLVRSLAVLFMALGFSSVALAQPAGEQIAGTVDAVRDNTVWLTNGRSFPLAETPNVTRISRASLEDLVPGRFLAIAAYRASDGALVASEVRVFPDGANGNQSQREMTETRFCEPGCRPGDLMTNANIDEAMVSSLEGAELTVSVNGEPQRLRITDTTRLDQTTPGSLEDLMPGMFVLGFLNNGVATGVWVDWSGM